MRYLIVAHDAGGAEIVSSWVGRHPEHSYQFVLGGPAAGIFVRKLAARSRPVEEMESQIRQSDFVLTATSAESELEHAALGYAKRHRVSSAAYLDYWWSFPERFERGGVVRLPDEIWVGDEYALKLARMAFPGTEVALHANPYLLDMVDERKKFPPRSKAPDSLSVLYLCQPYDESYTDGNGVTTAIKDIEVMRYFLGLLRSRYPHSRGILRVRIRPHPAEPADKYLALAREFPEFGLETSRYASLVEDCAKADWAVGMYTMALVVAVSLGMETFHCLPPGARPFVLPYREIRDFNTFIDSFQ